MITRVRYFAGQVLGVAELETEERYVIERLRRRNRWLHGWGIVAGLRLSIGPKEIVVAPGSRSTAWATRSRSKHQPAGPCAAPAAGQPAT